MKLRIKGNSIRLRLLKKEVVRLADEGFIMEETLFANSSFAYEIKADKNISEMKATFIDGKITISLPADMIQQWPLNDIISLDNKKPGIAEPEMYILIEKDFKCIDNTTEDQSDNFENPKKSC